MGRRDIVTNKKRKSEAALREGSFWYHRMKPLQEDGGVKYSKCWGFESGKEAENVVKRTSRKHTGHSC